MPIPNSSPFCGSYKGECKFSNHVLDLTAAAAAVGEVSPKRVAAARSLRRAKNAFTSIHHLSPPAAQTTTESAHCFAAGAGCSFWA